MFRDKETFPIPIWSQRANRDSIFPQAIPDSLSLSAWTMYMLTREEYQGSFLNDLTPHVQSQRNSYGRSMANQDNYTHRANHNKKLL